MSKENLLYEAADRKREMADSAEKGLTVKKEVSSELAALMSGFPSKVLENSGVTLVPKKEEGKVAVIVGPDKRKHLESLMDWGRRDEEFKQKMFRRAYGLMYRLGQAVAAPVDVKKVTEGQEEEIEFLSGIIPGFKELIEYFEGGNPLPPEDSRDYSASVHKIFKSLSRGQQNVFKRNGMTPENMFQVSD